MLVKKLFKRRIMFCNALYYFIFYSFNAVHTVKYLHYVRFLSGRGFDSPIIGKSKTEQWAQYKKRAI